MAEKAALSHPGNLRGQMLFDSILSLYIEYIARLLRWLRIELGPGVLSIQLVEEEAERTLDERIARIDAARQNLVEGINAIDELKREAEKNKKDVTQALKQVAVLERDKASLNQEIQTMRAVLDSDVEAFRKVAGVPSETEIRKERYIGFISGVIASVIASGIVYGIIELAKYLGN